MPTSNRTSAEFDQFASNYHSAVNQSIAFSGLSVETFVAAKARYLAEFLEAERIAPDAPLLDIGCGVGTYEALLGNRFSQMHGIDVSSESIKLAEQKVPLARFSAYDGARIPYDDSSFAAAFAICVWHHVPPAAWPGFVAEAKRVLKPGGVFVVFEHNPWNPLTRWAVERCVFDKDAVLLSSPTARRFLKEGGFEKAGMRFILNLPAVSGLPAKVDRFLGFAPSGAQYLVAGRRPR
jgi:ubiquinone/menaquinone biosynthesis C-methylase UbiE